MYVDNYFKKKCLEDPICVGWSETRKRYYYVRYPPYWVDGEVYILDSYFKPNLMGGVPIGGVSGNTAYMGTLTWFAVDKNGNYYGITDAHVVYSYDTVYFPPQLLTINPQYTAEHIPILNPMPIGQVIWRSNLNSDLVELDMAVFTLNVKPYLISYGKIVPAFFDVPHELEPVIKVGARTGLTNGSVLDRLATIKMYEVTGPRLFNGSIFVLHTESGDSGGPIFVGTSIVGSVVGGTGVYAVANYTPRIIQALASLGLKPVFNFGAVEMLSAVPYIVGGSVLAFLAKII